MARYNTISSANTVTAAGTVAVPTQGLFTQFTGTAPYSVNIPDPTIYFGQTQTFYNATAGTITITTPSGLFKGPTSSGTTSQTIPTLTSMALASDGTNYIIINENGGPLVATTINASSTVTTTGIVTAQTTFALVNTAATTVNIAGAATTVSIGATGGTVSTPSGLSVTGLTQLGALTATGLTQLATISELLELKSGATGVVVHDSATTDIWYHSTIAANFTANFTNVPTTTSRALSMTLILAQGATAYIPTAIQIAGVATTLNWAGGVQPTGRANKVDMVSFSLFRVSSAWTVLGQLSSYG